MKNFPKTLVLGVDAWRSDGPSNTLPNIFSCWDPNKVALIYTRSSYPNDSVSNKYFQISENKVLKSILKPWLKTGQEQKNEAVDISKDILQERKRYAKAHKKHSDFMTLCREVVWFLGHWKTHELKKFISDFEPDVLFLPIYNNWYLCRIEAFLVGITKKPYVVYYADDDYSYEACKGLLSYFHRFILRKYVKKLIVNSSDVFAIVDKVKEEIDTKFGKECKILTKGVDFSKKEFYKKTVDYPIRFVYTGNLLIGRDDSLLLIADALKQVDPYGERAILDIYSQTELPEETISKLNNGSCHFHGAVNRQEVDQVQQNADVLIFAEALSGQYVRAARMSFSTKLTDYMANGKCIFAVGINEIAPIHYLKKYDAAIISTSKEDLLETIRNLLEQPKLIEEYAQKSFMCAKSNHNKTIVDEAFYKVLCNISKQHNEWFD